MLRHDQHSRPALQRARSHSSPSQNEVPTISADSNTRPKRPGHVRAHSLLSPGSTLSHDASRPDATLERTEEPPPTTKEKSHRIHLPGRSHTQRDRDSLDGGDTTTSTTRRRSKLHRYTQSLADHHHHTNSHAHHNTASMHAASSRIRRRNDLNADSTAHDSLPNLVAGLNAERNRAAHHKGGNTTAYSPADSAVSTTITTNNAPSVQRVMSNRSYRGLAASDALHHLHDPPYPPSQRPTTDLRRRATSDPRFPAAAQFGQSALNPSLQYPHQPRAPKSAIELDLERAERLRLSKRYTLTPADIRAKDAAISSAESELRDSLQQISHRGMEITRRLDYGYYNLLEKVGNLASVIHSFQTLEAQSRQLISNLEQETGKVDEHIRQRVAKLKEGFEEREHKIGELEGRQRGVVRRAEGAGERLERARLKVEGWEKREAERQEIWGRFWERVWWGVGAALVLILGLVLAKVAYRAKVRGGDAGGTGAAGGGGMDALAAVKDSAAAAVDVAKAHFDSPSSPSNKSQGTTTPGDDIHEAMQRVPDDVRSVLVEIEQRQQQHQQQTQKGMDVGESESSPSQQTQARGEGELAPLRVLDDL